VECWRCLRRTPPALRAGDTVTESEQKHLSFTAEKSGLTSPPTTLKIMITDPMALTVTPTTASSRQVWPGTVTAFALKLKADWDALPEPKPTMTEFTRLGCQQWERAKHKCFSTGSIKSLLRKRKYKADGNPL
jgi:hypothetical protein